MRDYLDMSYPKITKAIEVLSSCGYATASFTEQKARLDPDNWLYLPNGGHKMKYFAYFVSNVPSSVRDDDSPLPQDPITDFA
eukprot:1054091-Pyramimonas_sp.AAC.1